MSLAERKEQELSCKLSSLEQELDGWMSLSKAGQPFEKHHSQIRRIRTQLQQTLTSLGKALNQHAKAGKLLAHCRQFEVMILELHRVWDFFRSKLAQRSVDLFKPYLAVADEFAWACYKPAREAVSESQQEKLKQPPLVFFSPFSTPFTLARDSSYQTDVVAYSSLKNEELTEVLKAMPFSVVGVPWFQTGHIPDALIIAHEVGHTVETDFGLTDTIAELIRNVVQDSERQSAWLAWAGEIFADVYGVFSAGPAYASALMDFLAQDPQKVAVQERSAPDWEVYPTDHLRVVFTLKCLAEFGFKTESTAFEKAWRSDFPDQAMPAVFEKDAQEVAQALVQGVYKGLGGKTLKQLGSFSSQDQVQATKISVDLLRGVKLTSRNFRTMVAGSRLAFAEDPHQYVQRKVQEMVLSRLLDVREVRVRNSPAGPGAQEAAAQASEDAREGEDLFARLSKMVGPA
jgi:hypothetical protein